MNLKKRKKEMINKRLIDMLHKSKKYIGLTILMNWISLIANAASIFFIGEGSKSK